MGRRRKTLKVILSVMAAACALCLAAPQVAFASESTERAPLVSKYVEKVGVDDDYDLTLTVSADTSTQLAMHPADVVFVVDTTESMKQGIAGAATRWEALASSLSQVMNGVSAQGIDARYALVRFWAYQSLYPDEHEPYRDAEVVQGWTGQPSAIISALDELPLDNATNYQAAFHELSHSGILFSSGRDDAERIVVFLSDGEPNTYYGDDGYDSSDGDVGRALEHAKAELAAVDGIDAFYAIYVGSGSSDELALMRELAGASRAADKGAYAVGSKDELLSALSEILEFERLEDSYEGVSVVDELSVYAQVVAGTMLRITVLRIQDGPSGAQGLEEVGFSEGAFEEGAALALPATALNGEGDCILSASYDAGEKRVRLVFPPDYVLEKDYVYKVTFTIEPTDEAYEAYSASGYPDRGDAGTGATSAGAEGFHSNRSATVRFNGKTAPYPQPVIQANSLRASKRWDDGDDCDGLRPGSVTFKALKRVEGGDWEDMGLFAEASEGNGWRVHFDRLPAQEIGGNGVACAVDYRVEELEVPEGYTCEVSGDYAHGFVVTNRHEREMPPSDGELPGPGALPETPDALGTPGSTVDADIPAREGIARAAFPLTGDGLLVGVVTLVVVLSGALVAVARLSMAEG